MKGGGRLAVGLWLAGLLALIAVILNTPFTSDMSAFLPRAPGPDQQVLVDQLQDGVASRLLLVGIESGTPAARAAVSRAMAAQLRARADFVLVENGEGDIGGPDMDYVWRHRYALSPEITAAHFSVASLRRALQHDLELLASGMAPLVKDGMVHDPTGTALAVGRAFAGELRRETRDGVWTSPDGARALMVAQTRAPGFDIDAQEQAWTALRETFAEARGAVPGAEDVRLLASGPGIFGVKTRAAMKHDISLFSSVAIITIVALLLALYRSPRVLLLTLAPVVSGALAGLAAVGLWSGFVHGITVGFGTTLIGESVDYAIYLFVQSKGQGGTQASLARIWPTLRLGALVSGCGFLAMLFSSFIGFVQLGIFTIVGLATALAVTRYVLPALVPAGYAWTRDIAFSATLLQLVGQARRARLPLALLCGAALLYIHGERARLWQDDLSGMSPIAAADQSLDRALREDMGAPDVRYLVIAAADGQQQALELCERADAALQGLLAGGALGGYDSPCRYLPSIRAQDARRAALPGREVLQDNLAQALLGLPFAPQVFTPFLDDVAAAREAPAVTRAALDGTTLALKLDALLVERKGRWVASLPLSGVNKPQDVAAGLAAAGLTGEVFLLDLKAESDRLLLQYRHESLLLAGIGSLVIALVLLLHFRSFKQTVGVLAPLAVAVITTVAVLLFERGPLSIFNIFGLLLVVAVGSNYCLFFQRGDLDGERGSRTVTSLLVANVCTVIGFGALSMSGLPVLFDIGRTVALGTAISLVAAAILTAGSARPVAELSP